MLMEMPLQPVLLLLLIHVPDDLTQMQMNFRFFAKYKELMTRDRSLIFLL